MPEGAEGFYAQCPRAGGQHIRSQARNVLPAAAPLSGGAEAAAERLWDPAGGWWPGWGADEGVEGTRPGPLSLSGLPVSPSHLSQPPRLPAAQVTAGNALCTLVPQRLKWTQKIGNNGSDRSLEIVSDGMRWQRRKHKSTES